MSIPKRCSANKGYAGKNVHHQAQGKPDKEKDRAGGPEIAVL